MLNCIPNFNLFHICRDCFSNHLKIYPETGPETKQMGLCSYAEAEARGVDPTNPNIDPLDDPLTFFKCMLMLSSDYVFSETVEELSLEKTKTTSTTRDHVQIIKSPNYPADYPNNIINKVGTFIFQTKTNLF